MSGDPAELTDKELVERARSAAKQFEGLLRKMVNRGLKVEVSLGNGLQSFDGRNGDLSIIVQRVVNFQ